MTKSQLAAIGVEAILRFGFGTTLLILSKVYPTTLGVISNVIVFFSFSFYILKIKLCPDVQNQSLLSVIEACISIIILEFVLALWGSVECMVSKLTEAAFADMVNRSLVVMIADLIIGAMAVCIFLTVLIEGQVLQQAFDYYREKRGGKCRPANCSYPMPKSRDPNCPLHGTRSPQNCK